MKALVSIVIPTYNRKKVISRAIDSCLAQTYQEIEIIICDDHSSDGTLEYVRDKYIHHKNIRYCSTPVGKKGANAARNEGAKNAAGKFIAFLDSDDYWLNDSIENRLAVIENTTYGLVYGNVLSQKGNNGIRRVINYEDVSKFDQKKFLMEELSLCITSSIMVRKSVLEDIGYLDERLKSWQDDDLVVTVGMKYKIRHCLKPVAVIVASCNSISKCSDNVYQGCNGIVKKHKKEIIKYASYIRYLIWQVRIFSLWAKCKEQHEEGRNRKLIYRCFYLIANKMISPFFRHMYV